MFNVLEKSWEKKRWGEEVTTWRVTIPGWIALVVLAWLLPLLAYGGWTMHQRM